VDGGRGAADGAVLGEERQSGQRAGLIQPVQGHLGGRRQGGEQASAVVRVVPDIDDRADPGAFAVLVPVTNAQAGGNGPEIAVGEPAQRRFESGHRLSKFLFWWNDRPLDK